MPKASDIVQSVMRPATPTESEIAAWRALSRDEQVGRYIRALADPACAEATGDSMSDILAAARAQAAARNG